MWMLHAGFDGIDSLNEMFDDEDAKEIDDSISVLEKYAYAVCAPVASMLDCDTRIGIFQSGTFSCFQLCAMLIVDQFAESGCFGFCIFHLCTVPPRFCLLQTKNSKQEFHPRHRLKDLTYKYVF